MLNKNKYEYSANTTPVFPYRTKTNMKKNLSGKATQIKVYRPNIFARILCL